ncbi:MAG: hypothetical protein LBR31_01330 [Desulfovibrio sp.]|jgi:Fe-S-cluster containining protein|nr:hypothetical protein [Desulfovibrio sp.]
MQRNFHDYLAAWREIFPRPRKIRWAEGRLFNGYCKDCRYCCGPQDDPEPFPMALLPGQIRSDLAEDFYLLSGDTAYIGARGCKAVGPFGCRLEQAKRPVTCSLFPLVPANGGLYLYKICPAALFSPLVLWADMGRAVATWLAGFNAADLTRISLSLTEQRLAERYIYLDIRLF